MIKSVFRPSRMVNGKRVRQRLYYGQYRFSLNEPITRVPLGTTDKEVAERRLAAIVREIEQERYGIIPPRELRDAVARPLVEHLEDHVADLVAAKRTAGYSYSRRKLVGKLIKECGWKSHADVTPDSFVKWRSTQGATKAAKTLREYQDAIAGLLKWMVNQGRALANPLASVRRTEVRGHETRRRRALTPAEMVRLVEVDHERGTVYMMALSTGLRRGELEEMEWGDLHLEEGSSRVMVRASTTKNRKDATIWLREDLAVRLRTMRPDNVRPNARVFGTRVPRMDQFRADLAAAGIEAKGAHGRRVDFHALRHTFCSNLQAEGVPQRHAMQMMRHSEARLTNNIYTDEGALPTRNIVERLPRYDRQTRVDAQLYAQRRDTMGHDASRTVTRDPRADSSQVLAAQDERRDLSRLVPVCHTDEKSWGSRIRT